MEIFSKIFGKKKKEAAEDIIASKYSSETCALCGKPNPERKFGGQFWHKKCYRAARKGAKSLI